MQNSTVHKSFGFTHRTWNFLPQKICWWMRFYFSSGRKMFPVCNACALTQRDASAEELPNRKTASFLTQTSTLFADIHRTVPIRDVFIICLAWRNSGCVVVVIVVVVVVVVVVVIVVVVVVVVLVVLVDVVVAAAVVAVCCALPVSPLPSGTDSGIFSPGGNFPQSAALSQDSVSALMSAGSDPGCGGGRTPPAQGHWSNEMCKGEPFSYQSYSDWFWGGQGTLDLRPWIRPGSSGCIPWMIEPSGCTQVTTCIWG